MTILGEIFFSIKICNRTRGHDGFPICNMDGGRNLTVFRFVFVSNGKIVIKDLFSFIHHTSIKYDGTRTAIEAHILLMLGRFPSKRCIYNLM